MTSLPDARTLAFDVGGTVFDWHGTIAGEVSGLAADRGVDLDPGRFANAWRRRMFELLGRVRAGDLPWMDADQLHRLALDDVAAAHPDLELSPADRDALNEVWHRLRAWPDAPAAIERLRRTRTVVVLTVLSWSLVVDSSKAAGITWDGVLSCAFLGHYKPDPEAYRAGLRLLRARPDEVAMVAAHPGDLRAAEAVGMRTAYVDRPDERGPEGRTEPAPGVGDFDVVAEDFGDLATQLGA